MVGRDTSSTSLGRNAQAYSQLNLSSAQVGSGHKADNGKPSLSTDEAGKKITRGGYRHYDRNGDGKIELSFTIEPGFSASQQARIKQSLDAWQDVANITFKEDATDVDGSLRFIKDPSTSGGLGDLPNSYFRDMQLLIGTKDTPDSPPDGSYFKVTVIHEVGHGIGLEHPGSYSDVEGGYEKKAEYAEDTYARSVMSYWKETHQPGHDFNWRSASTPMLDDITAVQQLYGANTNTRKTDTTYGFNSNSGRENFSLKASNSPPIFSVWDGGGNDTLDFSGFRQRQVINLNAESFSDVGGLKGNVSIAKGVLIENAIGGAGNDQLVGNAANNRLKGGAGADKLRGGAGADVFTYDDASDSTSAMPDEILDFTSGADKIDLSGILKKSQLSTVRIVERFTGRPGEIVLDYNQQTGRASLSLDLTGNARPDVLINAQGVIRSADLVTGKDLKRITAEPHKTPDPKLAPKPGASDTVYGFNSNTGNASMSLNASSKMPWFTVSDPGGNDTLDFSGFKQAQRIDLRSGAASSVGGGLNNVGIANNAVIENAIGGSGDDLLIGNFTNNVLKGGAGADTLWGVGGANTYAYNQASDSTYSAADLIMDFVSGRDKIDLSALQREANTPLRLVDSFTGRIGDTVVTFNPQSGRYFVAVDLTGNRQTDFLVKSTRLIKPQDVIGLAS